MTEEKHRKKHENDRGKAQKKARKWPRKSTEKSTKMTEEKHRAFGKLDAFEQFEGLVEHEQVDLVLGRLQYKEHYSEEEGWGGVGRGG